MIKLLIDVFLHLFIFLVDIKLKKCVTDISEDPFILVYCPDKYKTQRMSDEVVDDSLVALTFIPDWYVTSKMFERLDNNLHAKDDILFYNEDFEKVTFIANQRHILAIDLDKITLANDNNFDEDDPDTITLWHLAWCINF